MRTKVKTVAASNPEPDKFEWDAEEGGLGIRYRSSRKPSWYFQARIGGKTVRRSLGLLDEMSRADAVGAANALRDSLTGKPPAPVLVPEIPKATVAEFSERFLRDGAPNWKPTTVKAHRFAISKFIVPAFGPRDLASVTAGDAAAWWAGMEACAGTRNRALAVLSGMMRYAELVGLRPAGHNPCQGLRRRKSGFKAHRLTRDEYQRLGEALTHIEQAYPVEIALLRFLALTGCRSSEGRLLRRDMIDGRRAALPDSKTGPRSI